MHSGGQQSGVYHYSGFRRSGKFCSEPSIEGSGVQRVKMLLPQNSIYLGTLNISIFYHWKILYFLIKAFKYLQFGFDGFAHIHYLVTHTNLVFCLTGPFFHSRLGPSPKIMNNVFILYSDI